MIPVVELAHLHVIVLRVDGVLGILETGDLVPFGSDSGGGERVIDLPDGT
jgi:D-arabinose 5-phosphate isomerase GutQ